MISSTIYFAETGRGDMYLGSSNCQVDLNTALNHYESMLEANNLEIDEDVQLSVYVIPNTSTGNVTMTLYLSTKEYPTPQINYIENNKWNMYIGAYFAPPKVNLKILIEDFRIKYKEFPEGHMLVFTMHSNDYSLPNYVHGSFVAAVKNFPGDSYLIEYSNTLVTQHYLLKKDKYDSETALTKSDFIFFS